MTMTLLAQAKHQLLARPDSRVLAQYVTSARRNKRYNSILLYRHNEHIATLASNGMVIWRAFKQINDKF